MKFQRFAWTMLGGLIGLGVAIGGGAGMAHADPDDATPPIIDDLAVLIPAQSLDPRDRDGRTYDFHGTGNYCNNRFVKCQVGGF